MASLSLWSCSDDDEGGEPSVPQPDLISEARYDNDYAQYSYDAQGRMLTWRVHGQEYCSFSYAADGASMTMQSGARNYTVPLDALGNAAECFGVDYTYYSGVKAGFVHTQTVHYDFAVGASMDKGVVENSVATYSVDDAGKYTSYTVTRGSEVRTSTILYGSPLMPNKSENFNPIFGFNNSTFLGKGPAYLPSRINFQDGYLTYTYVLYPSGHVRRMTVRWYDEEGDLIDTEVSCFNWKSGGTNVTGGVVVPGSVDARVVSAVEWADTGDELTTEISYNAQGDPATMMEQHFGEDPENFTITYPSPTEIAVNGTVVGALNAAGNITEIFGETYTYNGSGYLTKKTEEGDGGLIVEETYTYNADHCVASSLWKIDYEGDGTWDDEELLEFEYEDEDGIMFPNVTNSIDVAKYQWWGAFFGKVSPYLPLRQIGPDYECEWSYDLDENWYPTTIYRDEESGARFDTFSFEWEEIDD